jgi:hypothetical protein
MSLRSPFPDDDQKENHSTHEMVRALHERFTGFEYRLDGLTTDHKELKSRVDAVEKDVAKDISALEKHEAEACLRQEALISGHSELKIAFMAHAKQEEDDRRKMFWVLVGVIVSMLTGFGGVALTIVTKLGALAG